MIVTLSILAALIPTLIYVMIIYWFDRYEKEPIWLLTAAFLWGAIPSVIIALIFNTIFSIPFELLVQGGAAEAFSAALVAPPVEESAKGLALLAIFFLWHNEIDSPLDGIIYGAMVGMGFAMVENVFYFVETYSADGLQAWGVNILLRAIVFGLNHALFTSMSGLGIAVALMSKNKLIRLAAPIMGWCLAMFLHFVHNASVSFDETFFLLALLFDWGGVLLTLGIIIWSLVQERRWLRQYLKDEVAYGTLTQSQFQRVSSGRQRTVFNWAQLRQNGFRTYRQAIRFQQMCSELAYRKHHQERFQDAKSLEEIATLRSQLTALSPTIL